MSIIKNIADEQSNVCVVNSLNPFRIQGQKTISYEIFDQLGKLPDYHFLPVGTLVILMLIGLVTKKFLVNHLIIVICVLVIVNTFHLSKILNCL